MWTLLSVFNNLKSSPRLVTSLHFSRHSAEDSGRNPSHHIIVLSIEIPQWIYLAEFPFQSLEPEHSIILRRVCKVKRNRISCTIHIISLRARCISYHIYILYTYITCVSCLHSFISICIYMQHA